MGDPRLSDSGEDLPQTDKDFSLKDRPSIDRQSQANNPRNKWRIFFKILAACNFIAIGIPILSLPFTLGLSLLLWLILGGAIIVGCVTLVNIVTITYYLANHESDAAGMIAGILVVLVSLPVFIYSALWVPNTIQVWRKGSQAGLSANTKTENKRNPDWYNRQEVTITEAIDLVKKCRIDNFYTTTKDKDYVFGVYPEQMDPSSSSTGIYITDKSVNSTLNDDGHYLMTMTENFAPQLVDAAHSVEESCGILVLDD